MYFFVFMAVSLLEGLAIFILTLNTFRFKPSVYLLRFALVIACINYINYLIRETDLSGLAPIASILFLIISISILVRIPLFWSFVMGLLSYVLYSAFQYGIVFIYDGLGLITLEDLKQSKLIGSIVPLTSAVITIIASTLLYKKGYGFMSRFEKLRFRGEKVVVTLILVASTLSFIIIYYNQNLYLAGGFSLIPMAILIYYAYRKEKQQNDREDFGSSSVTSESRRPG